MIAQLGALGYLGAAVLYLLLTLLMVAAWYRRRGGGLLVAACFVSAVWALVLSAQSSGLPLRGEIIFTMEVLRSWLWIAFLGSLLGKIGAPGWLKIGTLLAGPAALLMGLLGPGTIVPDSPTVATLIGLGLALTGLILIEQLYRNADEESRGSLRPLVFALGAILAFDLFLYAQAALFSALDSASWYVRGPINALAVPVIALAARRNPAWDLDIFVSRQVVFYSTTLVAVGLYLLMMSLGGYLLIQFGGSWGVIARQFFFVGAIAVLVALLFSGALRARARVFLSKHFFRNKYDYREEWLRLVSTLADFTGVTTRQNAVKALAQIVDSPGGTLWVRDDDASPFLQIAEFGSARPMPDIAADDRLVEFIRRQHWLVDLREYRREPELYDNLELPDWLKASEHAWLIVPLLLQGRLFGLVMLNEAPHCPALNFEDRDLLKTVGSHVAVHLAQEQSEEQLSEAQQFEAFNRLTAFLMHDLNNLIAQQSLIVRNAEKHKRNPDFVDDAMETIAGSVERMKRVMAQLQRDASPEAVRTRSQLKHLVSAAVERCSADRPTPQFVSNGVDCSVTVDAEQFIRVLGHLIKNAQDATPDEGRVAVSIAEQGPHLEIKIEDNGEGMDPEFIRDRLFKPFESTKGTRGMGIGAYQAREFMRALGGELRVSSEPGTGTEVLATIPKAE